MTSRSRTGYKPLLLVPLACLLLLSCSNKPGFRSYGEERRIETADAESIEFYFASLDSIQPYIHRYPTGIETKAPNLDPRDFYEPRRLVAAYEEAAGEATELDAIMVVPQRPYRILGELSVDLAPVYYDKTVIGHQTDVMAPNEKPYSGVSHVSWAKTFDRLRSDAAKVGADAVLEIFCGKGVSSYWYPPTYGTMPTFGPGGQIVGNYSYSTPGGVGLTGWRLMGLAVAWE